MRWDLITGEYPPTLGGVSDYTRVLAEELVRRGDCVHVWTCGGESRSIDDGVEVHRLPGRFGLSALRVLQAELRPTVGRVVLLQYVHPAFGMKGLNLPFCAWFALRGGSDRWVMFHEVAFPREHADTLARRVLAEGTELMARLLARAATHLFVSVPAWEPRLRQLGARAPIDWLPIPSTLPDLGNRSADRSVDRSVDRGGRFLIGHFGTYGDHIGGELRRIIPLILRPPNRALLLLGLDGERFIGEILAEHPWLEGRIRATGKLALDQVAERLSECDLLIQPYPDGASARRTSLMAGLRLGLPIVTTFGALSESLWHDSDAVELSPALDAAAFADRVDRLANDPVRRRELGLRAKELYQERFSVARVAQILQAVARRG